jgi:6-phosphogluconolactonase
VLKANHCENFESAEAMADAAVQMILEHYHKTMQTSEKFSLVLCGGRSPQPLYRRLAEKSVSQQIDWQKVHIFWGDERCVPVDDERSNFKLAHDLFLSQVPVPQDHVHPMYTGSSTSESAKLYETQLQKYFGKSPPQFDLLLLGLGEDGHTASLFPQDAALKEAHRWVVSVQKKSEDFSRLTLTFPILNQALLTLVLVVGEAKADVLKKVLAADGKSQFPAQLLQPKSGVLRWLIALKD